MTTLNVIGLLLGIAVLIFLSIKGVHTILSALIASLIIILTNGMDIWGTINGSFMTAAGSCVTTYLLLFALGAVFGEVMAQSGSAAAISKKIIGVLGAKYVLLSLIIITAILSYAGISIFVIVFVIYPLAVPLLKEAKISKNLMPAVILLAGVTLMLAAPGSPTGTNVTPTAVLGTTAYAAPIMGIICFIVAFVIGYIYLSKASKKLTDAGEGLITDEELGTNSTEQGNLPSFGVALIPVIAVVAIVFLTKNILAPFDAINTALCCGVILTIVLNLNRFKGNILNAITKGIGSCMAPTLTTAAIIGFGGVVQAAPSFQSFVSFSEYLSTTFNPYVSGVVSINIVSGITGAALSGMKIFANTMLPAYLDLDINYEAMHRILVMASGGLDTLPHCSTLFILFGVMGLTHKQAYKHVFVVSVILPLLLAVLGIVLALIGIV